MLIDTHAHLASAQLRNEVPEIVHRAESAGVTRSIAIGTDLEDSAECLALADAHPEIHATVGIHPTSVTEIECDNWQESLREMAQHRRVAAIGEIGLDYFHPAPEGWSETDYRSRQAEFFTKQLNLAAELGLNAVIHQRDRGEECWRDIVDIVRPFHGRLRCVFHCFTAPWDSVAPLIEENGHRISFTGVVTFKSAATIQHCARDAARGAFMLETDAPYLAPVPFRGKRCEPAYVRDTAEFVASLREESLDTLARHTTAAANDFFRLS